MKNLSGKVALVTGASQGVGRGIALELLEAGATVYMTGRSIDEHSFGGLGTAIKCDHRDDQQVRAVFRTIFIKV